MVFHDSMEIVQMFISAESKAMMELPSTTIIGGVVYLMAAYYVLDVQYQKFAVRHSFFFQDIILVDQLHTVHGQTFHYMYSLINTIFLYSFFSHLNYLCFVVI